MKSVADGIGSDDRLGVYFMPEDSSPLAAFGNAVLGRDSLGHRIAPLPELSSTPSEWIETPAHYGFHATLRAPFRLAGGMTFEQLFDEVQRVARRHRAISLADLVVNGVDPSRGYTALFLTADRATAVDSLAEDCVRSLDEFRAPLTDAERARRRPERLDPAALARLDRWGYPHVLDGFRFHMTLSGALDTTAPVQRWRSDLANSFAERVSQQDVLDRIVICHEAAGQAFVSVASFPLDDR